MSVDATRATWQLTKAQVTQTEKMFLLSCADRAGETAECWPSIKRLCADTGMDRKTIISVRQSVMDKDLLEYTGNMEGRTKLIPVMRLTYVTQREDEEANSPKSGTVLNLNSTESGTVKQSRIRDTEPKRFEPKINTTSEQSSPSAPTPSGATPLDLVSIFAAELPSSPQPVVHAITKALDCKSRQAINNFKKYWQARLGSPLTEDSFRDYLNGLKESCPGFLAEYTNKRGRRQRNGLAAILNWENFEKYLNNVLF